MNKRTKKAAKRLIAVLLCLLCLLGAVPLAAIATETEETRSETTAQTEAATEATTLPTETEPAGTEAGETQASEPTEEETLPPGTESTEATEETEATTEPTETTAPAETEATVDPVQALYERLMACSTVEEVNAILYPETEEEQAAVDTLIAQFTEEQNAALEEKMEELGAYDADTMELGPFPVAIGNTLQVNASTQNKRAENFSYTLQPSVSGITCTKKEQQGALQGYTFKIDNSVPDGTYTAKVSWKYKDRGDQWVNDEVTIVVISNPVNASVFYLVDPSHEPSDNATSAWGNEIPGGTINKRGLTYVTSGTGIANKNYFIQEGDGRVLSMPDGMEYDESSKAYSLPKEKFGAHWTYIWNNWGNNFKTQYNNQNLTLDDIEMIYLKPYKLSQNNSVKDGYTYADHIDCTISIKLKNDFAARFWVTLPGSSEEKVVDYATYRQGSSIKKTDKAPTSAGDYKKTLVVNGITYKFDGWYNEDGQKVENWDYTPKESELTDGVVEFHAHYIPETYALTITKTLSGNMYNANDKFNFTVTYGGKEETFELGNEESKTLFVPRNVAVTVKEIDSKGYSYSLKSITPTELEYTALSEGKGIAFTMPESNVTVVINNDKQIKVDTGISLETLPYILILAVVAVGAVVMIRKRRNRDED